ncbi:hypothetical protein G7076_06310 [Sphingomonas sp. HDW15A]|uniref:hypothetical protein n=1 Tax=Sphingomonas sp. HDW15A TaxID=2714942 RepID=UPI001408C84C|nr:hypothetical protein [Sphingomonas sp. HDW15A]QIK96111.1 hypothetical protein G7076_06310 [Sphingomonas sp. HDW15A]
MNRVERDMRLAGAEDEVSRSREQVIDTFHELAERLAPKKIAKNVWESAKVKGADMAEDAVDAVKRRPVAATGVVAAITMFLAREPIKNGIVSLYDAMTSEEDEEEKEAPTPAPAPRRPRSPRRPKTMEKKS